MKFPNKEVIITYAYIIINLCGANGHKPTKPKGPKGRNSGHRC